jgi:hypothetical protein
VQRSQINVNPDFWDTKYDFDFTNVNDGVSSAFEKCAIVA